MGRPRKEDARDTRQAILDAALEQFAQNGYFGTGVRAIAQAAGVRESGLYHHFDDKLAILKALLAELGPGRARQLETLDVPVLVEQLGAKGLIKALIDRLFDQWVEPKEMLISRVLISESLRLSQSGLLDTQAMFAELIGRFARLMGELVRLGAVRKVDPQAAALSLMAPMMVLRLSGLIVNPGPPNVLALKAAAFGHIELLWRALEPDPDASAPRSKKGKGR